MSFDWQEEKINVILFGFEGVTLGRTSSKLPQAGSAACLFLVTSHLRPTHHSQCGWSNEIKMPKPAARGC